MIPVQGNADPISRVFPGIPPHELDEMELWQIAVLLDRHKIEPPLAAAPPDYEKRLAMYQRVIEMREKERSK